MKNNIMMLIAATLLSGQIQASDFLNREITSVYLRNEAPKGVYVDINPAPENCGTGTDYLITDDAQWDDYTKAMYSYVLSANMSKANNLRIQIDCNANPKKIIRIK